MEQEHSVARADAGKRAVRSSRLPVHFLALAILYFAAGTAAAPWAVLSAASFFYQMTVLAWVHTFTLGFITTAIMGVMFRFVPALTKRELRFPRVALAQWWFYLIGSSGVISHFLLGSWDGVWMAGVVVVIAIVMFAANMIPCLVPSFGRGTAESGMLLGIVFLLAAGTLGVMLALDKSANFMPGDVMTNLAAHAHLAGIGWFAITICAVSYRFAPALAVTSHLKPPRIAIWQLYSLAAVAIGLAASLLVGKGGSAGWTIAAAILLVAYVVSMSRYLAYRTVATTWTLRHVMASLVFLLIALAAGILLAFRGVDSEFGSRLAACYGILALLGWISNLIIGMSYELFGGIVAHARDGRGWRVRVMESITIPAAARPVIFVTFNLGVIVMVAGLMTGQIAVAEAGSILLAVGGLLYSGCASWTLSFAYRD